MSREDEAEQRYNIYGLITELEEALEAYFEGVIPDDWKTMGQDNDSALFALVYEPLMNIQELVNYAKSN